MPCARHANVLAKRKWVKEFPSWPVSANTGTKARTIIAMDKKVGRLPASSRRIRGGGWVSHNFSSSRVIHPVEMPKAFSVGPRCQRDKYSNGNRQFLRVTITLKVTFS